jgi:hypothetical protein
MRDSVLKMACRRDRHAQVGVIQRLVSLYGNRMFDQLDRSSMIAALVRQNAGQMERVRVVGLKRQQFAI